MGDIALHCVERGSGFPLLLLHGNGESSEYFKSQLEAFSKTFSVIAVDTRGHGASPRGTAPFTLDRFAEDLKEFLDSRRLERIFLLGFSDGANVALLFTLRYPRYVEKLVLNGANLFPVGVKLSVQLPIWLGWAAASLVSRFDKKAVEKRELLALMVKEPRISPSELAGLRVPTLVIAGNRDMIRDSHTRLIAASIPDAELRIIEGGHFIAAENSERFNREVLDFLGQKQ